jgi:uncharacterized membrane protein
MPIPNPLHPAVVHFPLVLGLLLPLVALWAMIALRRSGGSTHAWRFVAITAVLLSVSAWVSVETGQRQEDRVERVVAEAPIHAHEEAAEGFLLGSAIVTGVVLLGLLPGAVGRGARVLAIPGALLVVALAVRVGDSGGALVYRHGAASAYVEDMGTPPPGEHSLRRSEREEEEG